MNKLQIKNGLIDDVDSNILVTLEGNYEDNRVLVIQGILSLISSLDLKDTYDGDYAKQEEDFEKLLFAILDNKGYESFYWEFVPSSEKHYNENRELVVSKKAKIDFLKLIIEDMEKRL